MEQFEKEQFKKKHTKHFGKKYLTMLCSILLMVFTLEVSLKYAQNRYYMISMLVIAYTIIPFLLSFEQRKPEAKEVVVLAVLCGIAVASRACFAWIPHFKPMAAFIIITGAAFGMESGFVCGVMSAFVSNFLFAQGSWTPWQMFAFGVAGMLSGLIFYKKKIRKNKVVLSLYGFVLIVLVVGPILDTYSVVTALATFTWKTVLGIYFSGLPVNIIHGSATMICLYLVSQFMFEKLERLQKKYGIMEG